MSAETAPKEIFIASDGVHDVSFAFERAVSRLTQMSSKEWLGSFKINK